MAAKVARAEKRYDGKGVVALLMVMARQCERWVLSLEVRPSPFLSNVLPQQDVAAILGKN
jgi:hypothetical protein